MFRGIGVSAGIVIGKAYVLGAADNAVVYKYRVKGDKVDGEIQRFKNAIAESRKQLSQIKGRAEENVPQEHLFIIDTHLMILKDEALLMDTIALIKNKRVTAEWAIKNVIDRLGKMFERVGDEYFKGKKTDIEHIFNRVISNLRGKPLENLSKIREPVVVIANDITPSDAIQMNSRKVIGFATDLGGKTSHTSILAANMGIPAVVGLNDITNRINSGDPVIIDGNDGIVIVRPGNEVFKRYLKKQQRYKYFEKELLKYKDIPGRTKDGYKIAVMANISNSKEVTNAVNNGADGIGLYRTEYLYLNKKRLPSEEEMFTEYRNVAKDLGKMNAVIRTIDLGGDKLAPYFNVSNKLNPALGVRAIRFCLSQVKIFKTQLRSILRASSFGNLRIMYPMISSIEELRSANKILEEVKEDLRNSGIAFNEDMKVGIMIEVPSAAIAADILAKEVDFFSIGTNDLIQYTIAIDRGNEQLSYLYQPLHPSILRLLQNVVLTANDENIEVSVCGEMGSDPNCVLILIGLGKLDSLSMDTHSIPKIKKMLQMFSITEAREITREALTLSSAEEINKFVGSFINKKFSGEFN